MAADDPYECRRITATIGLELGGLLFDTDGNEAMGAIIVGLETVGVAAPPNAVRCVTVRTNGTSRVNHARIAQLKDELSLNLRQMPGGEFVKVEAVIAAIEEITEEALSGHGALMDPDDLVLCVPVQQLRELLRNDVPMTEIATPRRSER